jgi:hypothetical protein
MGLPHRCIATSAALTTENTALLLLRAYASVGMCLPNRCLEMNYSGSRVSRHNIHLSKWLRNSPCVWSNILI